MCYYLVCADASTLCRQSDIGKTLIGKESTEDFEQVARVVVPFEAKLMMRHFHRVCNFLFFFKEINVISI